MEEIFYRGLTLKAFEKKMGGRLALVVSSLLFAVAHLQLIQFPALFLFGVLSASLAIMYHRLGSTVWAHASCNASPVIALLSQG